MSVAVSNRINDLLTVLRTTEEHSVIQLQEIALELDTWKTKVRRRGGEGEGREGEGVEGDREGRERE